jgi:hypothetical protein
VLSIVSVGMRVDLWVSWVLLLCSIVADMPIQPSTVGTHLRALATPSDTTVAEGQRAGFFSVRGGNMIMARNDA